MQDLLTLDVAFACGAAGKEGTFTKKLFWDGWTGRLSVCAGLESILSGVAIRDEERLDTFTQRNDCRSLLHEGRGGRRMRRNDRRGSPGGTGGQEGCGATQEAAAAGDSRRRLSALRRWFVHIHSATAAASNMWALGL